MDLAGHAWTQFLWEQFGESVLGHLRKASRDFDRDVHSLLCVHSQWRRGVMPCIEHLSPRLRFPRSLAECVEELAPFTTVRNLTLPPLLPASAVDLSMIEIQSRLVSLTLRQVTDADFAANNSLGAFPSLRALKVEGGIGSAHFLDSVVAMTHLESLELRDLEFKEDVPGAFLSKVTPQLTRLVVDNCFKLTAPGLLPIRDFVYLRELTLGLDSIKESDVKALSQCAGADVSLILYGERKLNEFQLLTSLENLKSLKLKKSWMTRIPSHMRAMTALTSLTFSADTPIVLNSANDVNNLPRSLLSLSLSLRYSSPYYMEHFIQYAQRLMKLKLSVPMFTKTILLHECSNLTELDISARECDGEALASVARCAKLKKLQIGGFLSLGGIHVRSLASLLNLREMSICSSTLTLSGHEELSKLTNIERLSFHFCPTLHPNDLYEMPHLRCMSFGCCFAVERNLSSLLARPFIASLNFIGFKFCCGNAIPPPILEEFAERVVSICVDPNIALPE